MDYRYLKAFLLTAEYKSFSIAARKLNVAQSAISRQVKLLEESVKKELMIRSSKHILLTTEGEKLYLASKQFEKLTSDIFKKEDFKIKIGILHGLLENWFNEVITDFLKKNSFNFKIEVHSLKELKESLKKGQLDLILTTENIQSEIVSSLKLFDETLVLISKNPIRPSKINQARWIAYNSEDKIFQIVKKPSKEIIYVNSVTSIISLVKKGVGVAVVPDHLTRKEDNLFKLSFDKVKKSEIFLATLNYKVLPYHLKRFINFIAGHD